MNDTKLKVYQFQHPLFINTFDRQDMVDEGDQTINQHISTSFLISPSKMSTMFLYQQHLRH